MSRHRRYYEPEDLGSEQDRRDAAIPNRRYYVYVLDTDYGHYVGHTAHVGRRFREHRDGETPSTAGSDPELAWTSGPLQTRADAARFEAAMKALRDKRARRFEEITGLEPVPFAHLPASAPGRFSRRGPYRPRRYSRPRDDRFVRFLRREIRGIFRSRRKRRMWLATAAGLVLLGFLVADSIGGVF